MEGRQKGGAEGRFLESLHCRGEMGCWPPAGSLQLLFKVERFSARLPARGKKDDEGELMGSLLWAVKETAVFAAINTWRMSSKQGIMIGSELLICYSVSGKCSVS